MSKHLQGPNIQRVLDKACSAKDLDMQINFNFKIQTSKLKRNLWDEI